MRTLIVGAGATASAGPPMRPTGQVQCQKIFEQQTSQSALHAQQQPDQFRQDGGQIVRRGEEPG